ncbi:hypothetical protein WEO_01597 [Escherichia coli KTE28]|nr:hypothetical protein WEO_01597 [Escherichia coli KTE28]
MTIGLALAFLDVRRGRTGFSPVVRWCTLRPDSVTSILKEVYNAEAVCARRQLRTAKRLIGGIPIAILACRVVQVRVSWILHVLSLRNPIRPIVDRPYVRP